MTEEVTYGATVEQPRRDKRSGSQSAKTTRESSGMVVEMRWNEPLAGHLTERYKLDSDILVVDSKVVIQDQSASARLVSLRPSLAHLCCLRASYAP